MAKQPVSLTHALTSAVISSRLISAGLEAGAAWDMPPSYWFSSS